MESENYIQFRCKLGQNLLIKEPPTVIFKKKKKKIKFNS